MATRKAGAAVAVVQNTSTQVGEVIDAKSILMAAAAKGRIEVNKAPANAAQTLSFRNGTISYQGRDIGHKMKVIMLHPQFERVYYADSFDADKIVAPNCYSFDGVSPHPQASDPQNKTCEGCPQAEWKSDSRGKGKACREGLRVALLAGDKVDATYLASAPIVMAKFSVLNSKIARGYLEELYETVGHPALAITELTCNPDPKTQLVNGFTMIDRAPAEGPVASAVASRIEEAQRLCLQPYPEGEVASGSSKQKMVAAKRVRKF